MVWHVHDGRSYFHGMRDGFFELLPFVPAGRMLDIGAAVGHYTKVMRKFSPLSPVTAFEPFPGNIPHFKNNVGPDPRVTLVQKAVMDFDGTASFHVPKIVSKGEGYWSKFAGFSSVGSVLQAGDTREATEVETCRIDSAVDEHVVAMKIDVQGAEIAVLRGASRLFAGQGIDFMFVEFSGEAEVLKFILDAGYTVLSSHYVLFTNTKPIASDWEIDRQATLSTGRNAFMGWPKAPPAEPDRYCSFFSTEGRRAGRFITNLVCVHARVLPLFEQAAGLARQARASAAAPAS